MTTVYATITNIKTKMATLQAGDTLQLAEGDYGALQLSRMNFASAVTIKGGTFSSIKVSNSSNIVLDGQTVNFTPTMTTNSNSSAVYVFASQHVTVANAKITGGLAVNGVDPSAPDYDATGNITGMPSGKGVIVNYSSDVIVINNDISLFQRGVTFAASTNISVIGNNLHNMRSDGIEGSVVSGLKLIGNNIHDNTAWMTKDHPDGIHIWTDKTTITGLVIEDNIITQGVGTWMQSISLDDNGKGLGFVASINRNIITAEGSKGISLENVSGTLGNNVLVWSGKGTEYNDTPVYRVTSNSHDLTFDGNTGGVSIAAGSRNLTFAAQSGAFTLSTDLTAADLATINMEALVVTKEDSYTLNQTTAELQYIGTANFTGVGNALSNHITSGKGNDTLVGNGGADVLNGGWGNDTYVVDNDKQTIIDSMGVDTVVSSISWTLQQGLEHLIYTGTADAVLTGNNAANHIVGGSGNDTLIGYGGADLLEGGLGNDTYVISNNSQIIVDTGGIDTVQTGINYMLGNGIENLTLTGTTNLTGTGNDLDNQIHGNAGRNLLDGKSGADTMNGGGGDDTYIVDNLGDRAIEIEGGIDQGGIDIVKASVGSFTLAAGIESLIYTGTGDFAGTGNAAANTLTGGAGNDLLRSMAGDDTLFGGAGNDTLDSGTGADKLTGGLGDDTFIFRRGEANGDAITDFNGGGTGIGDMIKLLGWGAGTTFTKASAANAWTITDGVDYHTETVSISGAVHFSDVLLG